MSAVLTAALGYTAAGWPVFLLGRSKRPVANCRDCEPVKGTPPHDPQGCTCLTCHGFYAATRDPKAIRRMLALIPGGMLAIRTGAASGLVIIDIDPRNGGEHSLAALRERGVLTPTRYVRTGGGGWHLYYRHPGPHVRIPGGKIQLGPGIDVKADGGYVAAPPAIHPDTRQPYAWADPGVAIEEMAPSLRQACAPPPPPPDTRPALAAGASPAPTLHRAGAISYPDRLLTTLLDKVRNAPPGRRRVTLYGCARGIAKMAAAGAISPADGQTVLLAACEQAGWDINPGTHAAISGGFTAEGITA